MVLVCVVGCPDIEIDEEAGMLRVGGCALGEGDWLFLDGSSGEVGVL